MYVEQNPELGIKLDIFYFSLEESRSKIIKSEICKYIHTKYGITISVKQLSSVGRYNTIPSEYFPMIEEAEQHVNDFLSRVHIIDTVRNATGIYKKVRDHALNIGTYYDKNGVPLSAQEMSNVRNGVGEDFKKVSYYKKHNDRHYVIIIVDHLSLLEPEKGESLHSTMGLMSSKYFLHFRDKFGFTPVSVQQLTSAKEAIEVNFQGKTIEEKLEPSLDALANNKETQRDANVILGLFNPDRYKIQIHDGYDIRKFRDRYRSLKILKDRDGVADKKLPLFFNGAVDFFKELPKADNALELKKVYEYINKLND